MKIESKKNYLSEGLVHKVYKVGKKIYKVPKDEFEDFNNLEHFSVERTSHDILISHSLPAAKVTKIYTKDIIVKGKYVLEEDYVQGKVFDNPKVPNIGRRAILDSMLKVNKIKINGYGRIGENGHGVSSSWNDHIILVIGECVCSLGSKYNQKISPFIKYLRVNSSIIPNIKQGYFLMLDTNSNNYIFDNDNKIVSMLDIDHPISGDVLYEYAALKFHHLDTFSILVNDYISLSRDELCLLNYYFIHFGLSTLAFESSHQLDVNDSFERLKDARI